MRSRPVVSGSFVRAAPVRIHARRIAADQLGMYSLLALSALLVLIGIVGGLARSIRGTVGTLLLVGLVFAVPAGAGQSNPAVYPDGGASWIGPAALAAALLVPYLLGLGLRHRLEHTASL